MSLGEKLEEARRELATDLPASLSAEERGRMDELLERRSAVEKDLVRIRGYG